MRPSIPSLALLLLCACSGATQPPNNSPSPDRPGQDAPAPAPEALPAGETAEERTQEVTSSGGDAAPPSAETALVLDPGAVDPRTLGPEATTSTGTTADGQLSGGIRLPRQGPGYRYNPSKRDEARYGVVEMIGAVIEASAVVERELPGSEALIGELSLPEGGPISGHGSHQAGRDVDVLFYLLGPDGEPFESKAIPLDPSGAGTEYGDLSDPGDDRPVTLDVPRTWRFVQAILEHEGAAVQRIFVVEHLRDILLEEAARVSAPEATVELFAAVTCQPGFPHDDHLHIRFFCPADDIDEGCADGAPIYPWQREALAAVDRKPLKPKPRRKGSRPKLTSNAKARAKAGPMHEDVTAFLDRRKAWVKKPHPGREYCK